MKKTKKHLPPSLVHKPALSFLGIKKTFTNDLQDPGYEKIWFNDFMPRVPELEAVRLDAAYYALVGGSPPLDQWTYMPALLVPPSTAAPAGMARVAIPPAEYAIFDTTIRDIGSAWGRVDDWFDSQITIQHFPNVFGIEYYPPGVSDQDSVVLLWVPVVRIPA